MYVCMHLVRTYVHMYVHSVHSTYVRTVYLYSMYISVYTIHVCMYVCTCVLRLTRMWSCIGVLLRLIAKINVLQTVVVCLCWCHAAAEQDG